MRKGFKLESLGIELPYNPKVRIHYNKNYEKGKGNGGCIYQNKKGKLQIMISFPNYFYLERMFWCSGKHLEMYYDAVKGHEEVHAAQFSGNFELIHSLAEKVLEQSFPKDRIKNWDKKLILNSNQLWRDNSQTDDFLENWAQVGEIITLKIKKYSNKDIEKYMCTENDLFSQNLFDKL